MEGSPLEALGRPVAKEYGRLSRVGFLPVRPEKVPVPPAVNPYMVKAGEGSLLCRGLQGTEARGQALEGGSKRGLLGRCGRGS